MTEFNNKKPLTKVSGIHYKKNIDNIVSKNEVTSFCNITKLFKEKKTGCGMAECFTPLEEQENINKTNYIQLIHDCSIRELIVPSLYRQLTEKGRKNVEDVFENKLEEK
ncbi:hypothetical protein HON01_06580, partial [Candidatus Woesearchaeota archaeon]|nr:hypothetical protein [Candidatus Woesearchaeota archaeon]